MFIVKEVARDLCITPQAIYKQGEYLRDKGYMIKNSSGEWEITTEGYNYLKEKRINQSRQQNVSLKDVAQKSVEKSNENDVFSFNETLKNLYENRIKELKESYENQINESRQQVAYFKNLYEQEKDERIKTNAQYQTYLLGTAEDNRKSHWWQFKRKAGEQ